MIDASLALVIATIPILALCVYLLFDINYRVNTIETKINSTISPDSQIYAQAAGQVIRLQKFIHEHKDEAISKAYSGEESHHTQSD